MAKKSIGILTGGGDVPGLNGVIKGVTYRADELGFEVVGIRRGWEGLTHLQPGNAESERSTSARWTSTTPAPSTAPAAPGCTARAPTHAR